MCLADNLVWETTDALPARVVACTRLHHSNELRFRSRLPLVCGLVRFDTGPVAVCFLAETAAPGDAVLVRMGEDDLLEAS